jgi:hypothetical protein
MADSGWLWTQGTAAPPGWESHSKWRHGQPRVSHATTQTDGSTELGCAAARFVRVEFPDQSTLTLIRPIFLICFSQWQLSTRFSVINCALLSCLRHFDIVTFSCYLLHAHTHNVATGSTNCKKNDSRSPEQEIHRPPLFIGTLKPATGTQHELHESNPRLHTFFLTSILTLSYDFKFGLHVASSFRFPTKRLHSLSCSQCVLHAPYIPSCNIPQLQKHPPSAPSSLVLTSSFTPAHKNT